MSEFTQRMVSPEKIHLINFSRKLTVSTIFFLAPLYFLKIGFNGWQIGIVISLYAFAPLLFSYPTGWINDRFSMRRVIQSALLSLSLLFLLVSEARNFFLMALLFLLLGMANNALDVSLNSLYFKDERDMDLNRKYGQLTFWMSLGPAVGTLFGGILTYFTSFKILFYAFSFFILAVLFLVRNFGQEKFALVSLREYRKNLFRKKTIFFSILIFFLTLHWGVEGTVYTPFLKTFFHFNNFQLSLYISPPLFFLAFSAFLISLLRYNARINKRIFLISMLLSGIGLLLMVNRSVFLSFLFRIVHEIGDGAMGALNVLFISRLFEKRSIGGSSGILVAIMTLGNMVGALLFSPLGYKAGLQYPFLLAGLLLVANAGFGYFIFGREEY